MCHSPVMPPARGCPAEYSLAGRLLFFQHMRCRIDSTRGPDWRAAPTFAVVSIPWTASARRKTRLSIFRPDSKMRCRSSSPARASSSEPTISICIELRMDGIAPGRAGSTSFIIGLVERNVGVYENCFPPNVNQYCRSDRNICLLRPIRVNLRSIKKKRAQGAPDRALRPKPVSSQLAALHFSPATVSSSLPLAPHPSPGNQRRILAAARKYKYRPNFFARSLRAQRSFTIGVIVPKSAWLLGFGYERRGRSSPARGFTFYFVVSHATAPT